MKEISREETGDFAVSFLEGLMGAARLNLHVKEAQAGDEGDTL